MKGRLRIDLHSHTCYSPDARTTPAQLIDPERIIVGEEIRCRCRTELIGLFLSDRIPEGLPIESVVERIRDQGGLVYAPHPWAYLVRPGRHARRAVRSADIVEVFNEDLTANKKPYHELSKFLTEKLTTHNSWYISKIFENLSSPKV